MRIFKVGFLPNVRCPPKKTPSSEKKCDIPEIASDVIECCICIWSAVRGRRTADLCRKDVKPVSCTAGAVEDTSELQFKIVTSNFLQDGRPDFGM